MADKLAMSDILGMIEMDDDARKVFLAMPRNEQLLAILGMQAYMRNELAKLFERVEQAENKHDSFAQEQRSFRKARLDKERELDKAINDLIRGNTVPIIMRNEKEPTETPTEKIVKEVTKMLAVRFPVDVGAYFRDKILPPLIIAFIFSFVALMVWAITQGWKP